MIRHAIAQDKAPARSRVSARRMVAALVLAGVVGTVMPAWAKPACYSKDEYEAEQAMRFHTEMMVVGLTCREVMPEKNLFVKYRDFTNRHRHQLVQWEKVFTEYLRRNYSGNPTRLFDTFRTELANQMSRRAASITTPEYCRRLVNGAMDAMDLSNDDYRMLAGEDVIMRMAGKPPCQPLSAHIPGADGPVVAAAGTVPAPTLASLMPETTGTARVSPAKATTRPANGNVIQASTKSPKK